MIPRYRLTRFLSFVKLSKFQHALCPGAYRSRYSDPLRAGRSGDRIPVGVRAFPHPPDRPWGPPSLLNSGYRFLPGRGKLAGAWR